MTQITHFSKPMARHPVHCGFSGAVGNSIPALPCLLAVGALSASGKFSWLAGLLITALACGLRMPFGFTWGGAAGAKFGFSLRISLEPDSCVRRTQNLFTRYGMPGIIVAKFVPGLSVMVPPLAGMTGVSAPRFSSWTFCVAAVRRLFHRLGFLFRNQIQQIAEAISNLGGSAFSLLFALVAIYIGSNTGGAGNCFVNCKWPALPPPNCVKSRPLAKTS